MKAKYTCTNCGAKQSRTRIEAMKDAGFGVHHLACKECGQKTITENAKEAK